MGRYPADATPAQRAAIDREWGKDDEIVGGDAPLERTPLDQECCARQSIAWIENAAQRAARAYDVVSTLEDERALIKPQAIKRLIESGAATSATAAEKIVEADPIYAAHRLRQRDAEIEKWGALGGYEVAKLAAQLDVALVTVMSNPE